ncbi:MAG: hypothetical protein ACI88A_001488 [Paraglaciecola sp.]|jgi:hypothetical protein
MSGATGDGALYNPNANQFRDGTHRQSIGKINNPNYVRRFITMKIVGQAIK